MTKKSNGRLTKVVAEKKKRDGKRMYLRGHSLVEIAEISEVSINTVKNWKKVEQWEEAKKVHQVSISEIKQEVLNTYNDLKNGKKPKVSADALRKLIASFQELNSSRKNAAYAIENFELLTDTLIDKAMNEIGKEKEFRLKCVKYVSAVMQEVANNLYLESLKNE